MNRAKKPPGCSFPVEMLSRRGFLQGAAAGAAGFVGDPAIAGRLQRLVEGGLRPELVTVTDTGFAAWWPSDAPADTVLRIAKAGGGAVRELVLDRGRTVHAAGVDDLEPGTRYVYELRSGTRRVPRSFANPGRFTTLRPPPGPLLATIAVLNDMHLGEGCSGTITNLGGRSLPPCFRNGDYGLEMSRAAVAEIAALRPDFVLANGDLTDRGRPGDIAGALDLLRGSGVPFGVTRGNHDRRLPGECAPDGDCLRAEAFPERAPWDGSLDSVHRVGARVAVVGLDSCHPGSGDGQLLPAQLAWLDDRLWELRAEGRIVVLAFHHHVALLSNATHPPPLLFGVPRDRGADELVKVLGRHDHVKLSLHGHTHRNYVGYEPALGKRLPFLENGACKEYPAGYALVRVYEGGIVRTFHRMTTDFARAWVKTTAGQIWGRHSDYTRGPLSSRAFVTDFAARSGPPHTAYGPVPFVGS